MFVALYCVSFCEKHSLICLFALPYPSDRIKDISVKKLGLDQSLSSKCMVCIRCILFFKKISKMIFGIWKLAVFFLWLCWHIAAVACELLPPSNSHPSWLLKHQQDCVSWHLNTCTKIEGGPTLKTLLYNTTEKKAFHSPKGDSLNPVNVTNQKYKGCLIPQLFKTSSHFLSQQWMC